MKGIAWQAVLPLVLLVIAFAVISPILFKSSAQASSLFCGLLGNCGTLAGLEVGDNLEKAIRCSDARCFKGCNSNDVKAITWNDRKVACIDFCKPEFHKDGDKMCDDDARANPVIFRPTEKVGAIIQADDNNLKDVIACMAPSPTEKCGSGGFTKELMSTGKKRVLYIDVSLFSPRGGEETGGGLVHRTCIGRLEAVKVGEIALTLVPGVGVAFKSVEGVAKAASIAAKLSKVKNAVVFSKVGGGVTIASGVGGLSEAFFQQVKILKSANLKPTLGPLYIWTNDAGFWRELGGRILGLSFGGGTASHSVVCSVKAFDCRGTPDSCEDRAPSICTEDLGCKLVGSECKTIRDPSITVTSTQSLVDNAIAVADVYLDKPGYILIHKDIDGKPGPVIGHSDLIYGEIKNFKIAIDAPNAGTKVYAMLHYDNGDGKYTSLDEDKQIVLDGKAAVIPIELTQQTTTQATTQTTPSRVGPFACEQLSKDKNTCLSQPGCIYVKNGKTSIQELTEKNLADRVNKGTINSEVKGFFKLIEKVGGEEAVINIWGIDYVATNIKVLFKVPILAKLEKWSDLLDKDNNLKVCEGDVLNGFCSSTKPDNLRYCKIDKLVSYPDLCGCDKNRGVKLDKNQLPENGVGKSCIPFSDPSVVDPVKVLLKTDEYWDEISGKVIFRKTIKPNGEDFQEIYAILLDNKDTVVTGIDTEKVSFTTTLGEIDIEPCLNDPKGSDTTRGSGSGYSCSARITSKELGTATVTFKYKKLEESITVDIVP